jgi:hypothetical protein
MTNSRGIAEAATLLGGLCAEYPIESRSTEVKVAIIACLVMTLVVVALRCIARWMVSNRLWWDDWTTLIATTFFVGLCSVQLVGASAQNWLLRYYKAHIKQAPV